MPDVTYEIVQHDGGWAYKVDGVFSEPFPTHAEALSAAQAAATEEEIPGHKPPAAATARTPSSRTRISYFNLARGVGAHSAQSICAKPTSRSVCYEFRAALGLPGGRNRRAPTRMRLLFCAPKILVTNPAAELKARRP
jgi:hypothetical protein